MAPTRRARKTATQPELAAAAPPSPPAQRPGRCAECQQPRYKHLTACTQVQPDGRGLLTHEGAVVCRSGVGALAIALRTVYQAARAFRYTEAIVLTSNALDVIQVEEGAWRTSWAPVEGFPVERAARLFVDYAQDVGATPTALGILRRLTEVTSTEGEAAMAKIATAEVKQTSTTGGKGPKGGKAATPPAPAKGAKGSKAAVATPVKGPKNGAAPTARVTAAARFRELIMAGKKTDAEIFEAVKGEFKLDDKKRTYVAWYRNQLKKDGQNPPDAKAAK